jgi:hypothetical protein
VSDEELRRDIAELRREIAELRREVLALRQPQVVPCPYPQDGWPWGPWRYPIITSDGTA